MATTQVEIRQQAVDAVKIYQRDQKLYDAFHGGIPMGLLISTIQGESGGRMTAKGDASIGEYGIMQVTSYNDKTTGRWEGIEAEFRVPRDSRKNKVGNIFLGCAAFNAEATRLQLKFPGLITNYTDLYKLSHLVYAVGRPGTYRLLGLAKLSTSSDVYGDLLSWAQKSLAAGKLPQLSKAQPPAKVWRRLMAADTRWKIAVASGLPMSAGPPVLPATPPSITRFTIPSDIAGHIKQQAPGALPPVLDADLRPVTPGASMVEGFTYGGPVGALYRWWKS